MAAPVSGTLPRAAGTSRVSRVAAMIAVVAAALAGCSDNSGSGPHRVSLPHSVAGYSAGNLRTGSAGTVFYADPHVSDLQGGEYHLTTGAQGVASPGTILLDAGHLSRTEPGLALTDIYARFKAIVSDAGYNPFGTMQAVSAGPLGGQASCWPVRASASSTAAGSGAMCAWADNDTFGLLLAQRATTASLAAIMLRFRSATEKPGAVS
jgi:hypothetical protein